MAKRDDKFKLKRSVYEEKLAELHFGDRLAGRAGFSIDQGLVRLDIHGFGKVPDLEDDVDRQKLGGVDLYLFDNRPFKIRGFRQDTVFDRFKGVEGKNAFPGCRHGRRLIGADIRDRNLRSGHDRPIRIGHRAADAASIWFERSTPMKMPR